MLYLFVDTYVHARGEPKQRVLWITVAFGVNFIAGFALTLVYEYGLLRTPWSSALPLIMVGVIVPIAVAYAVIRYRVIDVSFAVSQSLVYGILIALVIAVFAGIDWLMTKKLAQSRFEMAAYIAAALALGFVHEVRSADGQQRC